MFWYKIPLLLTPIEPSLLPGAGVGFVIMATLAIGPQRDITEIKIWFPISMCEMIFILPSKWAADYDEHVTGNRIQDSHPIHPSTHHLGGDLSIVQGAGQQEMLRPAANVNGWHGQGKDK